MTSRARKPRRPALAGKTISRTRTQPSGSRTASKKLSSVGRAGQGPLKRTMSLRDMATRRKGMKARAALQKAMLAGRTKQTRPTSPPPRPSGSGQKLRPSRLPSGMKTMYNRTRTKSRNRRQYYSMSVEYRGETFAGYNKPKRTPDHPKKSHAVLAKEGSKIKLIRFGEQGAKTAGKPKAGESDKMKKKRASFKARHGKNIAKGKMSAAYWANKAKW